jgi:hypothetical protein
MIPLLCALLSRSDPIYDKVKASLESEPSAAKDDLAILWALASFARALNGTLVAADVDFLSAQTSALIERFEITDSHMRAEFAEMRGAFDQTKALILQSVEQSRERIRADLDQFKSEIIGHVMSSVESTKEVHTASVANALAIVRDFFSVAAAALETHAVLFFVFFQVILLFGILFYRKLQRQMRLFLT